MTLFAPVTDVIFYTYALLNVWLFSDRFYVIYRLQFWSYAVLSTTRLYKGGY